MANGTTSSIVRRPVLELITASKPKFEGRLPQGMTVDRFMYGLATAVQKNPALAECDPPSVVLAAYEAAEVGCNLSPSLALGWLIPYNKQAQFQPSYRFFIQKAYETGAVSAFYAEVVYENDAFRREFAPKRTLHHSPPANDDRGAAIGAYALIEFKDGHLDWEYLTKEQIERHRKASKMPDSLMWNTFWEEAWKKTPLRVLAKRLPMSNPGMEKLAEIVERDAERERDPVVPGTLELEPGSPLAGNGHVANPTTGVNAPVTLYVGKMLTTLGGAVRDRFTAPELKQLGLRIGDDKSWTIPASLTSDFNALCVQRGVATVEVDDQGKPLYSARDQDFPEGMFDKAPETPTAARK